MGGKSHLEMFQLTSCFETISTVGHKIDKENVTRINRGLEIIRARFAPNSGVHKYTAQARIGDEILYGDAYYLWVLRLEVASCRPSCALNFEVALRFLENLPPHSPALENLCLALSSGLCCILLDEE